MSATPPITPASAPDWFKRFGDDTGAAIRELLRRLADAERRLKEAGL